MGKNVKVMTTNLNFVIKRYTFIPPCYFVEQSRKGSLFSLFLFSPLVAFCYVCIIADLRSDLWDSCQRQVRRIMNDSLRVFYDWSRCVGKSC